jgi:protein involved in ribonucleotide reduction
MLIVYFSSVTENTHRFVGRLGFSSYRIPLRGDEAKTATVNEPYVLICPTYGGGASLNEQQVNRPVPKQVIHFLNNEHNRSLIRGVIGAGNINFGEDFALAGDVISAKCNVPYLYRFELMGTGEDVAAVRGGLLEHAERLGLKADGQKG